MDLIFPILNTDSCGASNNTMANSLRIPSWLSKWNEGFSPNPTNWMDGMRHGAFPCSQRSSSSLGGMANPPPQPEDHAASSELVSVVTQSTCVLDKGTVVTEILKAVLDLNSTACSFTLSSEFLFEKLLNVSCPSHFLYLTKPIIKYMLMKPQGQFIDNSKWKPWPRVAVIPCPQKPQQNAVL